MLQKIKDIIICRDEHYNTFPNAVVRDDGSIYVAFRQAPDRQKQYGDATHVDPAARAVFVTSSDNGNTWDAPSLLYDDFAAGVQDPCIIKLKDGTLFCTYFLWKVFRKEDAGLSRLMDHPVFEHWVGRLGGIYSIRSSDGGYSWDKPIRVEGGGWAVRGNAVELEDGSIVLPTYGEENLQHGGSVYIMKSTDRGASWTRLAALEQDEYAFNEPMLHLTPTGKIVAFLRSGSRRGPEPNGKISPLFTSESYDGGLTWTEPVKRNIYSPSPYHALQLRSGKVLISYGYRFEPFGIRGFLLDSECENWEEVHETVLRDDAPGVDLGYTSAVQMEDDLILVTYYYFDDPRGPRYIAGTLCQEID